MVFSKVDSTQSIELCRVYAAKSFYYLFIINNCIDSIQLLGLCRVYSAEYYFENFALCNITRVEPRIVQCLYFLFISLFILFYLQVLKAKTTILLVNPSEPPPVLPYKEACSIPVQLDHTLGSPIWK